MENPVKLAIIDDDIDIQELVCAFFKPKGFVVKAYDDANILLKEVQKLGTCAHDVIITDLVLPTISGLDFSEKLKELGLNVPIILITGQRGSGLAVKAIQAGAYDFVLKPIHFPQLLVSVERAIYLNKIKSENQTLKIAVATKEGTSIDSFIGRSPGFLRAVELAKKVAPSNASIFITGETGTGKEVIAKAIHNFSARSKNPFIAINCSAIPENLLESELFGHAKGAFTGANEKKIGLFEEAETGTLFLDEIGDLSLSLQSKLLRVLQERKIKRIGENQTRNIDVRILSATHKDLRKEVIEKRFREDLFFRLNVIPISLPPLRERKEDVLLLAEFFLKKFSLLNNKSNCTLSKGAMACLLKNQWPGNVRELENTIERAIVLCDSSEIQESDVVPDDAFLPPLLLSSHRSNDQQHIAFEPSRPLETIDSLINRYIVHALNVNGGAKDRTAKDLGIDRKTLYRKMHEIEAADHLRDTQLPH